MLHALRKDLINIGHMALISNVEGIPRDPSDAPAPRRAERIATEWQYCIQIGHALEPYIPENTLTHESPSR